MKKRTGEILHLLDEHYGTEIICFLKARNAWELLVATILSAQCTDERVNQVTGDLFRKYPDVRAFADADLQELEQAVHSTGFYHNKAKNIKAAARILCEKYGGEVPSSIEELTALPGVGRKTANVVRGHIFEEPAVIVDTHVKRTAKRLALTDETDPVKVEYDLMKEIPEDHWTLINLQLITFGREICSSRSPKCGNCFLKAYCREQK